ncbi:MAG: LptF/LptG family permease [Planctomycetes bacterium]|nr:LptF/LptG family permease [Planctomycetota bacterium]
MFWGALHRMILWELVKIFLLALCALTGLILMAGIISEAMRNGLSPMQIVIAVPLMLPSLLPYTVPTTTLFATCVVYGRLSADNEILALKAAGVHIVHIVWPAFLLGAVTSGITFFLYLEAIPFTSFIMKSAVAGDLEEALYAMLRKDSCIKHAKLNYEIHVNSVQGTKLHDVIFKRRSADGKSFDFIAWAREAELHVDPSARQIVVVMWQCQIAKGSTVGYLDHNSWPVEFPAFLANGGVKQRASDMTWSELFDYEEQCLHDKEKISREVDRHQAQIDLGRDGATFRAHIANLLQERKSRDQQMFAIQCEWHLRVGFAASCLCFALVGCPVGIWFSKSDYLSAFITCFLPIVTVYYPLMFCTINMARNGKISPWASIYVADVVMLLAGVILFRRLARN